MTRATPTFYEFFAGGGMAKVGLGPDWTCLFSNDLDPAKARAYRENHGGEHLVEDDVWSLRPGQIPGRADLAWASSPCQDLSLAGSRGGLAGARSSAFWGFWRLVEALAQEDRAPRSVVIENVSGLLTSGRGEDFRQLCTTLADAGYRFGALEIDAAYFLPQSRPRLFVLATRDAADGLTGTSPFHTRAVRAAHAALPEELKARWIWWGAPAPGLRNTRLEDVLEPDAAVAWHPPELTASLLAMMSPLHRARVEALRLAGGRSAGTLFRRMRNSGGGSVQRAEVRFDGIAGCLRTPRGGSSRQTLVVVDAGDIRTRLLTAREGARLMGLPDSYKLPASQSAGLHVMGDGVAVPVVRWLAEHLLEPLVGATCKAAAAG